MVQNSDLEINPNANRYPQHLRAAAPCPQYRALPFRITMN